jgi:transposase
MGPIADYANANAITGRAGLFPGRHQSDQVDFQRMPLVRCANRRLRNALMQIAENLICCNDFFRTTAATWKLQKVPANRQRVKVARRFSRIAFSMVAGQQVFPHACCREPDYILNKLLTFILERDADVESIERTLVAAAQQIPGTRRSTEAAPLSQQAQRQLRKRGGIKKLAELLNHVVARLLGQPLQLQSENAASN